MKIHIKNRFILSLFTLLLFGCMYSCRDYIELDLDKKTVTILAPADNSTSPNFTQEFWWEKVEDADEYNLQIVKPSFAAAQKLVLDTTVKSNRFSFTLKPGSYQWRLRAQNSTSHTAYVTYTLTIDSTLDLSSQSIALVSPADNYFTKNINLPIAFSWQAMPNADSYLFQVLYSGSVINTQTPASTTVSYTFTTEGTYTWRVLAQNSNSSSLFSTRTITVDTTKPAVTSAISPLTDTVNGSPIVLKWNTVTDADSYRILVSTDSTFASVVKDTLTTSTTYYLYGTTAGQYNYWKVKSIDKAMNESLYFTRRRVRRN